MIWFAVPVVWQRCCWRKHGGPSLGRKTNGDFQILGFVWVRWERQTVRNVYVDREGKKRSKEGASGYNSNKRRVIDKERKKKMDQYWIETRRNHRGGRSIPQIDAPIQAHTGDLGLCSACSFDHIQNRIRSWSFEFKMHMMLKRKGKSWSTRQTKRKAMRCRESEASDHERNKKID